MKTQDSFSDAVQYSTSTQVGLITQFQRQLIRVVLFPFNAVVPKSANLMPWFPC
jgi:hypothetical protein